MIQQGLNQLLTTAAYFSQPIGEKRRDEKAFNKAQQEADKRVEQIMEITGNAKMTDEQIEYAVNLQSNAAKAQFERNPTPETQQNWYAASQTKEETMEQLAQDRAEKREIQKIKQDIRFDELRKQLRKEAGLD